MSRTRDLTRALWATALVVMALLGAGCSAESSDADADAGAAEFEFDEGAITVQQVGQMSVVIEAPEGVIYTDPTGGGQRYVEYPPPDLILVSHEHHEHYDVATLAQLVGPDTQLVVPPYVFDDLPDDLRANAASLANGQRLEPGSVAVEAVPSYGVGGEAQEWHPEGRGNGYVVTVDGDRRLYIAGSTEATPEMLELSDIYLALLPLYPPYALGPDDAVAAVSTFRPEFTYVYQYNSEQTRDDFVQRMRDAAVGTTVVAPDIAS